MGVAVTIEHLHTYLVYPNKGLERPKPIGGTNVPLEGQVFDLLQDVFAKSERECTIDISFNHAADGNAQNDCRSLILDYLRTPSVNAGLPLAIRLGAHTTNRSGLGLLFLACGNAGRQSRLLVARFAANSGIIADEDRRALSVQFIERVFLRNAKAYKAVVYQDVITPQSFWTGRAIDRQINSRETEVSRYWITDFLASDFRTTSAQGTKVLAVAMRNAARAANNLDIKKEITAAATLGANLNDQVMSSNQFLERFGLSPAAREVIASQMRHHDLTNERFRFSAEEFARQLPFKTVELNTGAMLTATVADFDEVFEHEERGHDGEVTFTATGTIVSEKIEKTAR